MNERLDDLVARLRSGDDDAAAELGVLSNGEAAYASLSACRYDLLTDPADPVEAWYRLPTHWRMGVCRWRGWPLEWTGDQQEQAMPAEGDAREGFTTPEMGMRKTEQRFTCADDIRAAVDEGLDVYWSSLQYPVRRDDIGRYVIGPPGGHVIELTWADGETLNGQPEEFFVLDKGAMH